MNKDGCICMECGTTYGIDLIVSDEQWAKISKRVGFKDGNGLLCGSCIMEEMENIQMYGAYKLMYPQKLTKREKVSAKLLSGMLMKEHPQTYKDRDHLVFVATDLTDLLLKKIGE